MGGVACDNGMRDLQNESGQYWKSDYNEEQSVPFGSDSSKNLVAVSSRKVVNFASYRVVMFRKSQF